MPSPTDTCPRLGKVKYTSRKEAQHALRMTTKRHNGGRLRVVYHCRFCGCFHFGTKPNMIKKIHFARMQE